MTQTPHVLLITAGTKECLFGHTIENMCVCDSSYKTYWRHMFYVVSDTRGMLYIVLQSVCSSISIV